MRIDVYLFENGFASSRTDAKQKIIEGLVTVNGSVITKASYDVVGDVEIKISESANKYASRGGIKLETAINEFKFEIAGRLAIDVGASTGGFTDCLLKNGAKSVISLDSGSGQLATHLRYDKRVYVVENYNARYLASSDLPFVPELAVMDVSFISATYIIPSLYSCLAPNADFICLIKPQFEAGKGKVGKGGIVKDEATRKAAIARVCECASSIGFECVGVVKSAITGGDGNVEYLAHFKKKCFI